MSSVKGDQPSAVDYALLPWQKNARQPVSWWDMLVVSAQAFVVITRAIEKARSVCEGISQDSFVPHGAAGTLAAAFDSLIENCKSIGLTISCGVMQSVRDQLREGQLRANELGTKLENFQDVFQLELDQHRLVYIAQDKSKFLPLPESENLFGEAVAKNFPSSISEIGRAGMCLATGLPTASVFHCMRILEIGLVVLGKEFSVLPTINTNWGPMLDQIESRIRNMHNDAVWREKPDWRELENYYSQAVAHFVILKNAWRNITMHTLQVFTEEEAECIFMNVKGFMQKLAERLHE